jgi:hypothetical protein
MKKLMVLIGSLFFFSMNASACQENMILKFRDGNTTCIDETIFINLNAISSGLFRLEKKLSHTYSLPLGVGTNLVVAVTENLHECTPAQVHSGSPYGRNFNKYASITKCENSAKSADGTKCSCRLIDEITRELTEDEFDLYQLNYAKAYAIDSKTLLTDVTKGTNLLRTLLAGLNKQEINRLTIPGITLSLIQKESEKGRGADNGVITKPRAPATNNPADENLIVSAQNSLGTESQPSPAATPSPPDSAVELKVLQQIAKEAEQKTKEQLRLSEETRLKEIQRLADESRKEEQLRTAQEARQREQERSLADQRLKDQLRIAEEIAKAKDLELVKLKEELAKMKVKAEDAAPAPSLRKALVIGNDNYFSVSKLGNARQDANAVSRTLAELGYKVMVKNDLNEKDLKATVRQFKNDVEGGDEVVIFYAGHGVQLGAANYLLPIDIKADSEDQVKDDAIQLQRLLDDMSEKRVKMTLAIIDACRDNPFPRVGRAIGGRGLAPTTAATGQMIIFSAGSGQQALDKLGPGDDHPNGLFTRMLLSEMKSPGVRVDNMIREVRRKVVEAAKSVGHDQVPAIYDQVIGDFYFSK